MKQRLDIGCQQYHKNTCMSIEMLSPVSGYPLDGFQGSVDLLFGMGVGNGPIAVKNVESLQQHGQLE